MNITLAQVLADPAVIELAQGIQEAEDELRSNPDNQAAKMERDRLAAEYRKLVNSALHPMKLPPLN